MFILRGFTKYEDLLYVDSKEHVTEIKQSCRRVN